MINRFLPIKVGARVLANMLLKEQEEYIPAPDFKALAARVAREYGLFLRDLDRQIGRKQEQRLAIGFPAGEDEEKSKDRYLQHFLCAAPGSALRSLSLCCVERNLIGEEIVGLTEAGYDFSALPSPCLDAGDFISPLSAEEGAFLRRLIAERLPAEAEAMRFVLDQAQARATQEQVKQALGGHLGASGGALEQMASGLLARMRELRLIEVRGRGPQAALLPGPEAEEWLTQ